MRRVAPLAALALLAGCRPSATPPPAAPLAPPKFADITKSVGLDFSHHASATPRKYMMEPMGAGGGWIDCDGDGDLDIILLSGRPLPGGKSAPGPSIALFRNEGGRFTDATRGSGLEKEKIYAMGCAVGDYDSDGRPDLYITSALDGSRLFRNVGGGKFENVTETAGVGNAGRWGTSCAWLDYDRDGTLDLFVCNYVSYPSLAAEPVCKLADSTILRYCDPNLFEASRCVLYKNRGDGSFEDVSEKSGIAKAEAKALGVAIEDINDDGFPEIFVANDKIPGLLFRNNKDGTFSEIGLESGVACNEVGGAHSGMGIDAADAFNDGKLALSLTNYQGEETSLYHQSEPELFEEIRARAGVGPASRDVLGFGLCFLDFDNDGSLDLFQVNGHVQEDRPPDVVRAHPTLLFQNRDEGRFTEAGQSAGEPFTQKIVGRGAARADFDGDGREDVLITLNDGPALLWRNETEQAGNFLGVKLIGTKSNRDGYGARVLLSAGGRVQRRLCRSGSSYLSASDSRLHFGLGEETGADLEIRWPSGVVQKVRGVAAGKIVTVTEAETP